MSFAKLVIIQPGHASRELKVEDVLVTIGRALDNSIALEDDSNVSRYHAEIERRGDEFWLVEWGSSNGTTLNDRTVDSDRQLDFVFQAEDGIRDGRVTGVQTCALPISHGHARPSGLAHLGRGALPGGHR